MKAGMNWLRSRAARELLAKLVMGISALVALADSALPQWHAEQEAQVPLVFAEQSEQRALLSISFDGPLYADLGAAELQVTATADRTASDLELSVHHFGADPEESAEAESVSEAEADFRAGSDAGSRVPTARAQPMYPNIVSLSVPVECAQRDAAEPRAASCLEQFEITLTRRSERPLSVDLTVAVLAGGSKQTQPKGKFEIHLEELAP